GDGVTLTDDVFTRTGGPEELVGKAARSGVGRRDEKLSVLGIVQSIIEARNRARGVAKRGMRRDVVDALAVDIDLAAVAQAFQIFRAGKGAALCRNGVLAFDPVHGGLLDLVASRAARPGRDGVATPAAAVSPVAPAVRRAFRPD